MPSMRSKPPLPPLPPLMSLGRTRHASRLSRCLALAAVLALAGCSTVVPADAADAEARLQRMVGDAACTQDAQCRTLPWGHKSCGGPQRWVAWSTARSDEADLQALAQALATMKPSALTPNTVTSKAKLRAIIEEVRRNGFSIVDEELEVGLRSVSVPLRATGGAAGCDGAAAVHVKSERELCDEVRAAARPWS